MFGTASWYSAHLDKGPTSSGEVFNQKKYTCASNHYDIGTWLRITNMAKGKSVVVRVNDRMGKRSKRLVDLSKIAAIKIGLTGQGLTRVKVENLGNAKKPSSIE